MEFITSKGLHYRSRTPVLDHRNVYTKSNSLMANWVAQLASTAISALLTVIILFIVAYGVQPSYKYPSSLLLQKAGVSLWCAPVYSLSVYLGFRSWRLGENSSLISFLVVNVIQLTLTLWELGASVTALGGFLGAPRYSWGPPRALMRWLTSIATLTSCLVQPPVQLGKFTDFWGLPI